MDELSTDAATDDAETSDYSYGDSIEAMEDAAREKGQVVRYPELNELFIDIDSADQLERFGVLLSMFRRVEPCEVTTTPSPSGEPGRFHVVVKLERPVRDAVERVLLQALLGSDPNREMIGWVRLKRGAPAERASTFFEKPQGSE